MEIWIKHYATAVGGEHSVKVYAIGTTLTRNELALRLLADNAKAFNGARSVDQ